MTGLNLETRIFNNDKIVKAMDLWPKAMRRGFIRFLYSTRKDYIGTKSGSHDGLFRRKHLRLKTSKGSGIFSQPSRPWSNNVIHAYKGTVDRSLEAMEELKLLMGTGGRSESKFIQGLYGMEKSTPSVNMSSSKGFVFPAYKNLQKRGRNIYPLHEKRRNKLLDKAIQDDSLVWKKKGDTTYVFDEMDKYKSGEKKGRFKKSALLFVLKKRYNLPKKIDFFGLFGTQHGRTLKRLDSIIKRQIRGIERGYIEAK